MPDLVKGALPRWDSSMIKQQIKQLRGFLNAQGYEDAQVHAHVVPIANSLFWDVWFHVDLGDPTIIAEVQVRVVTSQKQLRDDEQLSWLSMQGVDLSQQAHLELREQGLGLLFIDQIRPSRKLNNQLRFI